MKADSSMGRKIRFEAVLAVIVVTVAAVLLPPFTLAPEMFSQVLMGFLVCGASSAVLAVIFRLPWFSSKEPAHQHLVVWRAALITGAVVYLLPLLRFL